MDARQDPAGPDEHAGPLQFAILILSVVVLGALAADALLTLKPEVQRVLQWIDTVVCAVFLLDFVLRFRAAKSKAAFMKWGWIDLLASVPAVPALRWGRAVRLLRILRLVRGLRSLHRVVSALYEHRLGGGVASVAFVTFLAVSLSSVAILVCERTPEANIRTAGDAVWWSLTTVTTVGYGDRFPVTAAGRVVAMCLMVAGVGLFGTLSGVVASVLLGKPNEKPEKEGGEMLTEIRALRADVAELRRAQPPPPHS